MSVTVSAGPPAGTNPYPGDGIMTSVMTLYEARREAVLSLVAAAEPSELDRFLSELVVVALHGGM